MSTIENEPTGTPVPASTYIEVAQARVRELRRWQEQIPRFATPATEDATKRLASAASVPADFIELTNVAVANHPALVRVESIAPGEVRDLVAYADAFSPLADELEALAKFIRYSTTSARNVAGTAALTTYSLASRLARQPATAHLAPYVADMRRALGRARRSSPEAIARRAAARAERAAARKLAAQPEPELKPQA